MLSLNNSDLLKSQAYINGEWVGADNKDTFEILEPSTGKKLAAIPDMSLNETRRAIDAANDALPAWRALTAKERAKYLMKFFHELMTNQEDLARILSAECGKPIAEARGEVAYGAAYLEWFAEEGKRAYGDIIPPAAPGNRVVVTKEPIGVCVAITPWNFPNAMITRKIAPALAAGCTIVIKPSEETPLSALAIAYIAELVGIPKGVISVVTSTKSAEIGAEMTSNPIVRKLSFTGSTAVGKLLAQQSAGTMKRLSLELGGNAPFIVFDDADIDAAVAGALICKYRNAGQTCVCANRIYVQRGVFDEFRDKLLAGVKELRAGDWDNDKVTQGPLINKAAVLKVKELVADAVQKGGQLVTGGTEHNLGQTFFEPTIIEATDDARAVSEEIFGPVAMLYVFDTEEEVIEKANATNYGLAAYYYTQDLGRSWRVGDALEYGMVGINTGIVSNEAAPFGGVKESGQGREGSRFGLDDYMEIKYRVIAGI
jgi:succinate-semialdehyde dehydrogenase/glutarate-semialdehyde dehydrogenase